MKHQPADRQAAVTVDELQQALGHEPTASAAVRGRLNRARDTLRRRLSARNLVLPAALFATLMTQTLRAAPLSTRQLRLQEAAGHGPVLPGLAKNGLSAVW